MLAALPHSRQCTNEWMFLHQSAYLDYDLYCAGYPGHMHQDCKTELSEEERVNTPLRVANCQFGIIGHHHCHRGAQLAFRAEVESVLISAV